MIITNDVSKIKTGFKQWMPVMLREFVRPVTSIVLVAR